MGKHPQQRPGGAPRAALPPAEGGAAVAAAAAAGRTDLARNWAQFFKGKKRHDAEAAIQALHERAPSAMSCLISAKMKLLQAGEAALQVGAGGGWELRRRRRRRRMRTLASPGMFAARNTIPLHSLLIPRQEEDEAKRERAVLTALHAALRFAVAGVADHRCSTCLHVCALVLHCVSGRPGGCTRVPCRATEATWRHRVQGGSSPAAAPPCTLPARSSQPNHLPLRAPLCGRP